MEPKLLTSGGKCIIGMRKSALEKHGADTALFIGRVSEEGLLPCPVYMDSLFPHVVFICGTRGSGKSYTLGVIAEELVEKNPTVGVVIIDPIGVFWSMKQQNNQAREIDALKAWQLEPKDYPVKVIVPEGLTNKIPKETYDEAFSIPVSDLTPEDWSLTFKLDRFDPAMLLLERAMGELGQNYSIDDIIETASTSSELLSKEKGFVMQTRRGLASRLLSAKKWGVLSGNGTPIDEIVVPGQITVIDTSFLEESVANLVIGIIARKLLETRKVAARVGQGQIPPPWLLIDEAHTAIPSHEKTAASDAIIEYVKQGRRPGCSIVLATQQPSAVDSKVLSQLDLLVTHKLVFGDDIDAVFKRMPTTVRKEMKNAEFIRNLPLGQAVVGDKEDATAEAFVLEVRPRKSQHEGRAIPTTESRLGRIEVEKKSAPPSELSDSVKIEIELVDAQEKVKPQLHRKLLLGHDESIEKTRLVWWPIWEVDISYPAEQFTGKICFDAVTGDLIGRETFSGLLETINLKPIQRSILMHAQQPKDFENLSKLVGLDSLILKKQLKQLLETGHLRSWDEKPLINQAIKIISRDKEEVKPVTYYQSTKPVKVPSLREIDPSYTISKQQVVDKVEPVLSREDVFPLLEIWGKPKIKQMKLIHYPYWLFSIINGKRRLFLIDGVTGEFSPRLDKFPHIFEKFVQ